MAAKKAVKKAAKVVKKVKKEVKAKAAKPVKVVEKRKEAGEVVHFFGGISVAAVKVKSELKVGDVLVFKGATTDFKQKVDSMQLDNKPIQSAKKGKVIGLKVKDRVREHDLVYKE